MARRMLIPEDVADLFEDFYGDDYRPESLVKKAVLQLVENHRAEYEEIAGIVIQNEVDELKKVVARQQRRIEHLEKINPKNVNVPLLTETANQLQKQVQELEKQVPKKKRKRRF